MKGLGLALRAALGGLVLSTLACGGVVEDDDALPPDDVEHIGTTRQAITSVSYFGSNPGNLGMYMHVPAGLPAGRPLVVVLHGCGQSIYTFDARSEWTTLANRYSFAVLLPQQYTINNGSACFNWFYSTDTYRGWGEAASIKQMIDKMKADYAVDSSRVFITGLSAGGYMASAMMASYPEVFKAGAVMAGGPSYCAVNAYESGYCMGGYYSFSPQTWGNWVRDGYPGYTGPYPKMVLFHGGYDTTVYPQNLTETVKQWTNVHNTDQTADFTETFRGATHKIYKNSAGTNVVETWYMPTMGHAISVDPGTATDQGGTTGTASQDYNVYSSYYAAKSWGIVP